MEMGIDDPDVSKMTVVVLFSNRIKDRLSYLGTALGVSGVHGCVQVVVSDSRLCISFPSQIVPHTRGNEKRLRIL